ncbi:acyl-CoA dehydrogenase family protein [Phenylobacterium sp.]|uniref:acyl-CoA dehydrogenase family protein n=1 Tax=Phenylobacterium sp. TaxID=1871053 RepID=UPI0027312D35|nr:acyl-CoA dehydrogenase family protein [Phenylobacterium sp.]MDP1600363.1 acyl-CoA dehydrogenase family protein [Phenylobacterium sp.]MDP3590971.1 acyl-CoA dehydrogenase family protein [Phenylobacterium sp.]
MNLDLTNEEVAFRDEVRAFLDASLSPELREVGRRATSVFTDKQHSLPWQKILHAKGWAAPSWPVEYGGPGWGVMQRHIFAAECARAGAPGLAPMGLRMVGPVIMGFGTPEQKAHYLPRILSGEDYWCQGYSEPQAGSDLAALALRAVRDGDDYVLSGSKLWTTHAHWANRMFCLVRTDATGKPQAGITFLLLDMNTPGIRVRPIITLAGEHEVNEVFFDQVRVPVSDRVGEENKGWTVAKYLLEFERGGSSAPGLQVMLDRVRDVAWEAGLLTEAAFRSKLMAAEIAVTAIEIAEQRTLAALASGANPGPASSMLKAQGAEALQMVDELMLETAGAYAAADQPGARQPGSNVAPIGPDAALTAMPRYLNDRAATIYGGSNEIQRDIIARLVLGL